MNVGEGGPPATLCVIPVRGEGNHRWVTRAIAETASKVTGEIDALGHPLLRFTISNLDYHRFDPIGRGTLLSRPNRVNVVPDIEQSCIGQALIV